MISGDLFNASAIAEASGLTPPTVREHYRRLEEEGVGGFVPAWGPSPVQLPRFYFRNPGISLRHRLYCELFSLNLELGEPWRILHWRSSHASEVDFILERDGGVLCASLTHHRTPHSRTGVRGIVTLQERYPEMRCWVVLSGSARSSRLETGPASIGIERLLESLRKSASWDLWRPAALNGSAESESKAKTALATV